MVFSSFVFVSIFFPAVYLINRLLPTRWSNWFLLAGSLFLYAWGEPINVIWLIVCALMNYVFARCMTKRRKAALVMALIFNIGLLCVYKYTNFLIDNVNALTGLGISNVNIKMPLGISFFTFQAMSYTIDVYRGECEAQKSFPKLLLYISLFPQLIAGPIVKYHEIESQLNARHADVDDTVQGMRRFIVGLGKKVLLANQLAVLADSVFNAGADALSAPTAWIGAIAYAFQIYFDFSGYTDMAIGMGRMMGFSFPENFRHPYAAVSMQDFWRRWHISLSSWFRDYVYIPLGGNRRGAGRAVVNRLIVFFLTGLWHGASWNFVIWGLGNGLLLMLESSGVIAAKSFTGKKRAIGHVYVWLSFVLLFVIFRADTLRMAGRMYANMFTGFTMANADKLLLAECLTGSHMLTLAAAFVCAFDWKGVVCRMPEKAQSAVYIAGSVCTLLILWFCMASLASQSYNPFIYFRF